MTTNTKSARDVVKLNDKLTVKEICADLQISPRTFYEWRMKGTAPECIQLPNGELRVRVTEYQRWLTAPKKAA